jgi:GT2 family glycosyltransferase
MTPLVSIIIPTHNRKDMVIRLLASIIAGTYRTIEIIVVDDASTDSTSDAIKKTFPQDRLIRIVRNETNKHTAGSRNMGTRISKGKYLFFVDDDNVLDRHAISVLVRTLEDDKTIGELGLVNMYFRDKKSVYWLQTIRDMWTTRTYQPKNLREYSKQEIWDTVDAPNAFIIRADVIKKYGISFCEKYGIMYEESDVAYRIRNAGYTIRVARDAIIYHDVGEYMYHFMNNDRRWFVFARNRIVFHSMYSTSLQLLSILAVWIWVFAAYYIYKIFCFSDISHYSYKKRTRLALEYLRGNIEGILLVLRNKRYE